MENTEAPFVAWTTVEKDGYTWNVTVRKGMSKTDIVGLFDLIAEVQKESTGRGYEYKAIQRGGFPPKKEPMMGTTPCPTCQSTTVIGVTKDGRKYEKCSTAKYDFTSKTSSGCTYFAWK